jgi:hypothetical protein
LLHELASGFVRGGNQEFDLAEVQLFAEVFR